MGHEGGVVIVEGRWGLSLGEAPCEGDSGKEGRGCRAIRLVLWRGKRLLSIHLSEVYCCTGHACSVVHLSLNYTIQSLHVD